MSRRVRPAPSGSWAVLAWLLLAAPWLGPLPPPAPAAAEEAAPVLRVAPLGGPAPGLAVATPELPPDPRALALAERLARPLSPVGARALRAASRSEVQAEQVQAFEALRRLAGGVVGGAFLDAGAPPRMLKGAPLEHATRFGARPDRRLDEATGRAFLRAHRRLLGLRDPDGELRVTRWDVDDLGRRRLRFAHAYRGLPVWPSEVQVHLDVAGNASVVNGALAATPRGMLLQPALTLAQGLARARQAVPGGDGGAVTASDLVIYAPGSRPPRLAWRLEVEVSVRHHWLVVVDAQDGSVLTAYNQVMEANVPGSGLDLFGASRPLNVLQQSGRFFLVDTSKPMFVPTANPLDLATTRGAIFILDARNQPPSSDPQTIPPLDFVSSATATSGFLADGVSAAFNFSETYDYFRERHNRNSLDGQGGTIQAIVRLGLGFANAFFNPAQQLMGFGDAVPFAGALDVVAHELTHGVTFHTANLIYQDQPGALNEAFSDIFGELVEARTSGRADWITGAVLGGGLRNLRDPNLLEIVPGKPYPKRMSQFVTAQDPLVGSIVRNDNGGVHLNSTIIGHAFYLLAEGLPGAIGLDDAGRIFYRALTVHLVQNSQFVDARLACIQSAEELFGPASVQVQKTIEAFTAVEITGAAGTPPPPDIPPVSGQDSLLFVFRSGGLAFLGRREAGVDPAQGAQLSVGGVVPTRPSVTSDGQIAAFVDSVSDMCLIATEGGSAEICLGFPGLVWAVAMSPDGQRFAFVFQDEQGNPDNRINLIELSPERTRTFQLVAPLLDGVTADVVLFADAMAFTADGRFLIYDALNELTLLGGARVRVWSIFALDLATGRTLALVPPVPGVDIGFPALAHTSDDLLVFDVVDQATSRSRITAVRLSTGERAEAAVTASGFGAPGYAADDGAVVYSDVDAGAPTGFSIRRQPLAADRLTPSGASSLLLRDADFGVMYRRAALGTPLAQVTLSALQVRAGQLLTVGLSAQNPGLNPAADLYVGVVLPDGRTALFFAAPGTLGGAASLAAPATFRPMQPLPPGTSLSLPTFFQFTLPPVGVAPGTYQVFAALIRQGALADNRIDPGDLLALDVKPLIVAP